MNNLFNKLKRYIENIESNPFYDKNSDSTIRNDIIQLLHDYYEGNLLNSFLVIEQLNKEKLQKENNLLYQGLQDGMHNLSSICKHLLEDKNSKNAKNIAQMYFTEDNLAFIINIARAYFSNGNCTGSSENGRWFFETFKSLLIKYKDKYLKGGSSYDWACSFGHIDYIKLVLNE